MAAGVQGVPGLAVACAGPGCGLARGVARALGAELIEAFSKRFPDGEAYVRIEGELRGRLVAAVATGYPEPSTRVLEHMLLVEASRGLGAAGVVAVAGYLAYSRQDRRFLRGEPVSVRAVLRGIAAAGAEGLAAVDVHKPWSLDWFPGPAVNVEPWGIFAEAIRPALGRGPVYVIAPDRGALPRAKALAERLGAGFDYLEKSRDRVTGEVVVKPRSLDVQGAEVVLVDDITSTGGTLAKAARLLLDAGAKRVLAAVTHCLLAEGAIDRIKGAGIERLYCSNTVDPGCPEALVVDVSPAVAEAVRRLAERLYGYESEGPR